MEHFAILRQRRANTLTLRLMKNFYEIIFCNVNTPF